MYQAIKEKKATIAVVGLGYVGLPLALAFAKHFKVIGFDINSERIALMNKNIDPSNELESTAFENSDIVFTNDLEILKQAHFYVVAVPTPIDEHNVPNLKPLLSASETIAKVLKKGDYVVYESTVYPGCTEEDCLPILEQVSGLKLHSDFKLGYSPERINPGDKVYTLESVVKVASGSDAEALEEIASIYGTVVKAGIHKAVSIKVAEAAKIIENTQRDVNISLVNELSIIFNKIGINTYDVLEAAGTKWNFLPFMPGLVGGHCIGVDPYYLTFKAEKLGYHAKVINSGRYVNDSMGFYIAKQTIKKMIAQRVNLNDATVLILGATFKENVSDIRNSKVVDIIKELLSFGVKVEIVDPKASTNEFMEAYGYDLLNTIPDKKYDAVIFSVPHTEYATQDEAFFMSILKEKGIFVDVKGLFRKKITNLNYWSL